MSVKANNKTKRGLAIPGWLMVPAMVLYNEGMLYFWTTRDFQWSRAVAVILFALGMGYALAFLVSLIGSQRASKWISVAVSALVTTLWLTEFFLLDAYGVFMSPATVINGAGGVAEDYSKLVAALLLRNLWRIGLMFLPIIVYAIFCYSPVLPRKQCLLLAVISLLWYASGFCMVYGLGDDAAGLGSSYHFDSAVRCFGLNMAFFLEAYHSSDAGETVFLEVEQTPAPTRAAAPASTDPTEPEEVVYAPNILATLDFEALAAGEKQVSVASVHRYVGSLTPSYQNAYTGLFKGKNLILITAEAFSKEVIDPDLTPTLYRMATKGIQFTDYYQPAWGASTISGEYSNLVGLVPTTAGMCMKESYQQDLFLLMGKQLSRLGYQGGAYHNHTYDYYERQKSHVALGYDEYVALYRGLEQVTKVWPESDCEMILETMPRYMDKQPFSVYYMTVSGHCMYSMKESAMSRKNYDRVADTDWSETVKCYLAANLEFEDAMAALVQELERRGIADDTVIVISADHYPYGLERSTTWKNSHDCLAELYGVDRCDRFMRDHNALIIWSGCLEDQDIVVEEPVYSLDILPTLSNLFGLEYDSRLLIGRDVFSEQEPLVLWPDYSWKTDLASYDFQTKEFIVSPGAKLPEGYKERIDKLVSNKIKFSGSVSDLDYYSYLAEVAFPEG